MKKIALLSFHNAANYGAALQAFALQEALTRKGYVCEYIDYRNTYRSNAYNMSYHIWSNLKARKLKSAFLYFLGTPFMCLRNTDLINFIVDIYIAQLLFITHQQKQEC